MMKKGSLQLHGMVRYVFMIAGRQMGVSSMVCMRGLIRLRHDGNDYDMHIIFNRMLYFYDGIVT